MYDVWICEEMYSMVDNEINLILFNERYLQSELHWIFKELNVSTCIQYDEVLKACKQLECLLV